MESVLIDSIVGQPTLNSVRQLAKQIMAFTSHFETTKSGGKGGFLPLILSEDKMRLAAGENTLDCQRLAKPKFLNTKIKYDTKGCDLLHIQEEQRVQFQEYIFQEGVDFGAVDAIVAVFDAQYIKELEEDYLRHKNRP